MKRYLAYILLICFVIFNNIFGITPNQREKNLIKLYNFQSKLKLKFPNNIYWGISKDSIIKLYKNKSPIFSSADEIDYETKISQYKATLAYQFIQNKLYAYTYIIDNQTNDERIKTFSHISKMLMKNYQKPQYSDTIFVKNIKSVYSEDKNNIVSMVNIWVFKNSIIYIYYRRYAPVIIHFCEKKYFNSSPLVNITK